MKFLLCPKISHKTHSCKHLKHLLPLLKYVLNCKKKRLVSIWIEDQIKENQKQSSWQSKRKHYLQNIPRPSAWKWLWNWPLKSQVFFFSFIFISCRLITLQYCSGFCHTLTWTSHGFTCIAHPDPPSHLPLHPIPLGLPSAPAPSTCLMHPAWAGDLFHPR